MLVKGVTLVSDNLVQMPNLLQTSCVALSLSAVVFHV